MTDDKMSADGVLAVRKPALWPALRRRSQIAAKLGASRLRCSCLPRSSARCRGPSDREPSKKRGPACPARARTLLFLARYIKHVPNQGPLPWMGPGLVRHAWRAKGRAGCPYKVKVFCLASWAGSFHAQPDVRPSTTRGKCPARGLVSASARALCLSTMLFRFRFEHSPQLHQPWRPSRAKRRLPACQPASLTVTCPRL